MFQRARDAWVVFNDAGSYVEANPAACKLFGASRDELLRSRVGDFSTNASALDPAWAALRLRGQASGEVELKQKDGSTIHVQFAVTAGFLPGLNLSVIRDVTERWNSDADRRRIERQLVEAQRVAQIGSWEWDVVGRVMIVSAELHRVLGIDAEHGPLDLGALIDRVHPDDRAALRDTVERTLRSGTAFDSEYRIVRSDGTIRFVECRGCAELDEAGKIERLVGSCQDVTERREMDLRLRHAQRMETVGRLAGGIAHDFNNLLTAILGYSDLLLERVPKSEPYHGHLDQIRKAAERGAWLTQQLLAFGKRQVAIPELLDLGELVTDLSKMFWRLIGEDVSVSTLIHPGTAPIHADRGQVGQVLLNLVLNARDAMPHGGKLSIEVRNAGRSDADPLDPEPFDPSRFVVLAVSDNGSGMDEATRQRAFEPFFTTKGETQHAGLGLATVIGIVEQSGGELRVDSAPGQGSTFRVLMPRAEAVTSPRASVVPLSTTTGGHETVLLVEDEEMVRRLAKEVLEERGYTVLEALSASDALRLVDNWTGRLDLLLTDVVMPGMNGRELAETLGARYPGLPVIYMSGYTDDAVVRRGVRARDAGFLQKPFTPLTLTARVREILDSRDGPD